MHPVVEAYEEHFKAIAREEGRKEGKKEGKKEGGAKITVSFVEGYAKRKGVSIETSCDDLGVTVDEYTDAKAVLATIKAKI